MGMKPRTHKVDGFRAVLADPPWPFHDVGNRMAPSYSGNGRYRPHYGIDSLANIKAMGALVKRLVPDDAFLFLWAPNALVLEGTPQDVAREWGFTPKQLIPWVKTDNTGRPRLGGGHYTRVCTEQLLLCRRGRAQVKNRGVPGVIVAPRSAHSAKPDEAYRLIEALVDPPYLELYARRRANPHWTVFGNEAPRSTEGA